MSGRRFTIRPVAAVRSPRVEPVDDYWGGVESVIDFDPEQFGPESLLGLAEFSHAEVLFVMDRVAEDGVETGARHPRERLDWPLAGIFAQRGKARPNRLGVSRCRIVSVRGLSLTVRGLDAIDGTPVADVKPYMEEFGVQGEVRQPEWSREVMKDYYKISAPQDGAGAPNTGPLVVEKPDGMLSHVFVGVTDFDRAFSFYTAVLGALDLQLKFLDLDRPWAGWMAKNAPRPLFLIGAPFNTEAAAPGNGQMVAFRAKDREAVDRVYTVALKNGGTCEGRPGLRPQYHANYYGAYFRDFDGNKICICSHDPLTV
jgi:tRNA (adenine37-N6)-methyltransferase